MGNHNNSNMVLVDVKMLSGFTPVMSSIEEVSKRSPVFQPPKSSNVLMKQLVSKASCVILHLNKHSQFTLIFLLNSGGMGFDFISSN